MAASDGPIDPRILGQLLLLQGTLHVMPTVGGIGDLVCRGLSSMPGVSSIAMCIRGVTVSRSVGFPGCGECHSPDGDCRFQADDGFACIRLRTINGRYGWLVFRLCDPSVFLPYRPHVENIANVVALTLENRNQESELLEIQRDLERRVEDRTRELRQLVATNAALAELAETLISLSSLDAVSALILDHATRLTGSRTGVVGYIDPATGTLVCPTVSGNPGPGFESRDGRTFLADPGCHWGWAVTCGQPVLVNRPGSDPRFDAGIPGPAPVRRLLAVPAMIHGGVVGQIALADADEDYSNRDLELVGRLCSLYALAIQRARDAEERRFLSEQVQRSQQLQAIGVLAGGIAHEFRNLLQIVQGFVDVLLLRIGKGAPGGYELQEMGRAAQRGAELTQQLLAFSRKAEMKLRPTDLNRCVRQVAKLLERTIPRMIQVTLRLSDDLGLVNADPGQIEQVLLNLAFNARDAMPDGGKLSVETAVVPVDIHPGKARAGERPGVCAVLRVTDTGHGMDEATAQRVFEPFFTTKEVGKGTGLGLAVSYGIVEAHGGRIACESRPGRGTTFTIQLPLLDEEGAARPAREPAGAPAPGGRERILVVDDEDAIRAFMAETLRANGYSSMGAATGEEALEILTREGDRIDLVILDVSMPGMGGEACLRKILDLRPGSRVILSSGYPTGPLRGAEARAGRVTSLTKPFRLAELLQTVRESLDG